MSKITTPRVFIAVSALLFTLSALIGDSPITGSLSGLFFFGSCGYALGGRFLPNFKEPFRTIIGSGVSLALIAIIGSIFFYAAALTTATLTATALFVAGLAFVMARPKTTNESATPIDGNRSTPSGRVSSISSIIVMIIGLVSLAAWWVAVLTHPVTESVRSPWLVLSPFALIALVIPTICSIVLLAKQKTTTGYALLTLTLFSGLSLAAAMYPLGYGFDPFLHRTTVDYIAQYGTITPKPLYYIGQYAIELFGVKLMHLPLFFIDVYLAPLLTALLLPAAWIGCGSRSRLTGSRHGSIPTSIIGVAVMMAVLPMAAFIETTPQALSFIFTAMVIFLTLTPYGEDGSTPSNGVSPSDGVSTPTPEAMIFALAAFMTHPLSGAIAILYLILTTAAHSKIAFTLTFIGMSLALPIAFSLQAWHAHQPLGLSLPTFAQITALPISHYFTSGFNGFGDLAYFIASNIFLVLVIIGIVGVTRSTKENRVPFFAALATFINFLVLTLFFNFNYLIAYERQDFALRTLTLVALFLLPYVAVSARESIDGDGSRHGSTPTSRMLVPISVLISLIFSANVYAAYPRDDGYERSAGFNVEQSDVEAILSIESNARGQDYAVLSNQAVAAAAVETLGFKKYYHGDIFFYPIPTGGKLYNLFLAMNEQPSLATINEARQLTGASTIYFVVNNYWWKSDWIIENTKNIASTWFSLDHGSTTVFIFTPPPSIYELRGD